MKEIPLTKGMVALVDDEDFDAISAYSWNASESCPGSFYARRIQRNPTKQIIYMHRVIAAAPRGVYVDHKNRNRLDNRRDNLRIATPSLNQVNRVGYSPESGYRGVYRATGWGREPWFARISQGGEFFHLGRFHSAEEAARAYDRAAAERFGEFAILNFPGELQCAA